MKSLQGQSGTRKMTQKMGKEKSSERERFRSGKPGSILGFWLITPKESVSPAIIRKHILYLLR